MPAVKSGAPHAGRLGDRRDRHRRSGQVRRAGDVGPGDRGEALVGRVSAEDDATAPLRVIRKGHDVSGSQLPRIEQDHGVAALGLGAARRLAKEMDLVAGLLEEPAELGEPVGPGVARGCPRALSRGGLSVGCGGDHDECRGDDGGDRPPDVAGHLATASFRARGQRALALATSSSLAGLPA